VEGGVEEEEGVEVEGSGEEVGEDVVVVVVMVVEEHMPPFAPPSHQRLGVAPTQCLPCMLRSRVHSHPTALPGLPPSSTHRPAVLPSTCSGRVPVVPAARVHALPLQSTLCLS
jgi:hypothetical protein